MPFQFLQKRSALVPKLWFAMLRIVFNHAATGTMHSYNGYGARAKKNIFVGVKALFEFQELMLGFLAWLKLLTIVDTLKIFC